ncbi:MAG: DnaJ domain-containing protein [Cytophagaceae bacterium]
MQDYQYYSILSLPHNASEDDIKKAYRQKAKECHPDVNNSPDAHKKFMQIRMAYEILLRNKQEKRLLSTKRYSVKHYDFSTYRNQIKTFTYENKRKEWEIEEQEAREKAYKKFKSDKEKLKNSIWYYPAFASIYIITALGFMAGSGIILLCFYPVVKFHPISIFFLIPFICASLVLIKYSYDWFKKNRQYFD